MFKFIFDFFLWLLSFRAQLEAKRAEFRALLQEVREQREDFNLGVRSRVVLRERVQNMSINVGTEALALVKKLRQDRWLSPEVSEQARKVMLAKEMRMTFKGLIKESFARGQEKKAKLDETKVVFQEVKRELKQLWRVILITTFMVTFIVTLVGFPVLTRAVVRWHTGLYA